jgi:hypothetical protein
MEIWPRLLRQGRHLDLALCRGRSDVLEEVRTKQEEMGVAFGGEAQGPVNLNAGRSVLEGIARCQQPGSRDLQSRVAMPFLLRERGMRTSEASTFTLTFMSAQRCLIA